MLYLKAANLEDWEKEYEAIIQLPENENGFENKYYNVSREEFKDNIIQELINHSKGIDLPDGYVPDTYYFLWDDQEIVGLFKIRHYLNDFLASGPGHIGYAVLPKNRGKGYATKGLALAINECKKIIPEDEIYLSVHKDNPSSLRVQEKNGAYIVAETEKEFLTRIKIK